MKTRHLLTAGLFGAVILLSGCNDKNGPFTEGQNGTIQSFSDYAKSLIALVTGGSCDTALPADINRANVTDDDSAQDANAISPACTS